MMKRDSETQRLIIHVDRSGQLRLTSVGDMEEGGREGKD
jgi:hypothetical protein